MGIVRFFFSIWVFLFYMVFEEEGEWYLCGDYRRLNDIIIFDRYFILYI